MSLISTKPRWFPQAVATELGWVNPFTSELLVSHGGLKSKIAAELATSTIITDTPIIEQTNLISEEPVYTSNQILEVQSAVKPIDENIRIAGEIVKESKRIVSRKKKS